MKRFKVILLLLLVCAAIASAHYALKPLIYRAHMIEQCEKKTEEFYAAVRDVHHGTAKQEEETDRPYKELYDAIMEYNDYIFEEGQNGLTSRTSYQLQLFDLTQYGLPDQTFGVIYIPKMDVELPLYLGASDENMANGAAVLSQTSVPIGGENTNAVIAGHRGWNGYKYFQDIELLDKDDKVYITTIWETLVYKVSEIKVVTPDDIGSIHIQPGRDMITLLTCHPYASGGKYRYLVFCDREDIG